MRSVVKSVRQSDMTGKTEGDRDGDIVEKLQ